MGCTCCRPRQEEADPPPSTAEGIPQPERVEDSIESTRASLHALLAAEMEYARLFQKATRKNRMTTLLRIDAYRRRVARDGRTVRELRRKYGDVAAQTAYTQALVRYTAALRAALECAEWKVCDYRHFLEWRHARTLPQTSFAQYVAEVDCLVMNDAQFLNPSGKQVTLVRKPMPLQPV